MRRLVERAPGTFQHSVAVGLLARQAAEAIGADGLLVRVGALYHDIGKTEHPEYFSENQRGENPHDRLPPAVSAQLIREHVSLGVELLGRHGVGDTVADFAREHQGTGELTMFLRKALASDPGVNPAAFRYSGPRPASRETAVLMMADRVEATARAVGAATRTEFRTVVDRSFDALAEAGQLEDSPLTLKDLRILRGAFVNALVEHHHHRVAYPTAKSPGPGEDGTADPKDVP